MTSVAAFELRTNLVASAIRNGVSKYWYGKGRQVDICSWWPDEPNHILCVLEYFYHCDSLELRMLVDTANYLTSIAENEIVYYYRCIDFISDRDPKKPTYKSGEDLEILNPNDLYKPEYCPSMSACDIYLLQL